MASYNQPHQQHQHAPSSRDRVCIIGSGNWGSAIAVKIGCNVLARPDLFESNVHMWVYEEDVEVEVDVETAATGAAAAAAAAAGGCCQNHPPTKQTQKLSQVINQRHENVKYLPGVQLPSNIVAVPDLKQACQDATLIVFVVPHQFLAGLLPTIRQYASRQAHCRGVSLIKGLDFDSKTQRPVLISQQIERVMNDHDHNDDSSASSSPSPRPPRRNFPFRVGVLMGANVAHDVAVGKMCESTLACSFDDDDTMTMCLQERTRLVFHSPTTHFHVHSIQDVVGAELCGSLKNVVALGAGMVDGLDKGGDGNNSSSSNTKAALLRVGLLEMRLFGRRFFGHQEQENAVQDDTFWESCGVADLITTAYGGRNRKCAEAWTRTRIQQEHPRMFSPTDCQELWNYVEQKLLAGQKLQGTVTAKECYQALQAKGWLDEFPLMTKIYRIAFMGDPVESIVDGIVIFRALKEDGTTCAPKVRSFGVLSRL